MKHYIPRVATLFSPKVRRQIYEWLRHAHLRVFAVTPTFRKQNRTETTTLIAKLLLHRVHVAMDGCHFDCVSHQTQCWSDSHSFQYFISLHHAWFLCWRLGLQGKATGLLHSAPLRTSMIKLELRYSLAMRNKSKHACKHPGFSLASDSRLLRCGRGHRRRLEAEATGYGYLV